MVLFLVRDGVNNQIIFTNHWSEDSVIPDQFPSLPLVSCESKEVCEWECACACTTVEPAVRHTRCKRAPMNRLKSTPMEAVTEKCEKRIRKWNLGNYHSYQESQVSKKWKFTHHGVWLHLIVVLNDAQNGQVKEDTGEHPDDQNAEWWVDKKGNWWAARRM